MSHSVKTPVFGCAADGDDQTSSRHITDLHTHSRAAGEYVCVNSLLSAMGAQGSRPSDATAVGPSPATAIDPSPASGGTRLDAEDVAHRHAETESALALDASPLTSLPPELQCAVFSLLPLESLSALASTSKRVASTLPDTIWRAHVSDLARAADAAPEDVKAAERRITNSIQRQAAIEAASEAAEAAAFSVALARLVEARSSDRLRVGLLRPLVCNLCKAMPSGAMYFPTVQRGVCRRCVRTQPAAADSWRYHQTSFEAAAVERRDAKMAHRLRGVLAAHIKPQLCERSPRLRFSSDVHGGSLATMLRRGQGACASVLVVVTQHDDEHEERLWHSAAARSPTILSQSALRDIGRLARRRALSSKCQPHTFGAYCPSPWPRTPNAAPRQTFGDATSLIFSLSPREHVYGAKDGAAVGGVFRCDGERGISIGGDEALPGIGLSADLASGRCLPCHTFGDISSLTSSSAFSTGLVQLWDLTPPGDGEDESIDDKAAIEEASVLTARRADAMMLPFRTSMMLRVE